MVDPQFVYLTKEGERRVLDGKCGMLFRVLCRCGVADRCVHVEDRRYPREGGRYQGWTLGPGDFEPLKMTLEVQSC